MDLTEARSLLGQVRDATPAPPTCWSRGRIFGRPRRGAAIGASLQSLNMVLALVVRRSYTPAHSEASPFRLARF